MNNTIFDLLKLFNAFNQPQNTNTANSQNSSAFGNYPFEAFTQPNNHQNSNSNTGDNNLLPLLMSMLGKGGDFSKIFAQNSKGDKEEIKKESNSPKDEILL